MNVNSRVVCKETSSKNISFVNQAKISPVGVTSKNDIGARRTLVRISRCTPLAVLSVARAKQMDLIYWASRYATQRQTKMII